MKQNMRDLIVLGTIAVIFDQHAEIIHNSQVFVDNVLFCGTCVLGSDDM